MCKQETVLRTFENIFGKKTLAEMANLTGIQITRIHRIKAGRPMKLIEYEKFSKLINTSVYKTEVGLVELAEVAERYLTNEKLNELKNILYRNIEYAKIANNQQESL